MNLSLRRIVTLQGRRVLWCNVIGVYSGQRGHADFKSAADARRYARYAGPKEGEPPALDRESLRAAGIPEPIAEEWK